MQKTFVKVVVEYDTVGNKKPLKIYWGNKSFDIEKVIEVKNRASLKVGGVGERYLVKILNTQTYLFYEDGKWFVEEK